MVEGALTLTLVVYTLIAIVDVGQVLTMHQGLAERARAGARWAVVNPYDSGLIRNMVVYATPYPESGAKAALWNLSTSMVSCSLVSQGTPDARVVVGIQAYPFRFFTPVIAGLYTAKPIVVSMPVEEPY